MTKEDKEYGLYLRGNLFGGEDVCLIQVPREFYVAYVTGKISLSDLKDNLDGLVNKISGRTETSEESRSTIEMMLGDIANPYKLERKNIEYGDELDKHLEAYEHQQEEINVLLTKIDNALSKRLSLDTEGNYTGLIESLGNFSRKIGYGMYERFTTIFKTGVDEFKLRNELYKKIMEYEPEFKRYFMEINKHLIKDESINKYLKDYDVITLLHTFSRFCTRLLKLNTDTKTTTRKQVTDLIDNLYETKYDGRKTYNLDELINIKEELKEKIEKDLVHKLKDPKEEHIVGGFRLNLGEINYDNINFLDDAVLHMIKFVFGVDVKKEQFN